MRTEKSTPGDAESAETNGSARSTNSRLRLSCAPSLSEGGNAFGAKAAALIVFLVAVALSGCRQDMHDQPKYVPLRESTFFTDTRSAREPVPGTVARGQLREDTLLHTGKAADGMTDATVFPFAIDAVVMARGRERYEIFCSPCHARTGTGEGMVVLRGYRQPPTFHSDRLRSAPPGHFFDVITNGFGAMPDHASQIRAEDRWAIVAYIRALQLSLHAAIDDVPPNERGALQ